MGYSYSTLITHNVSSHGIQCKFHNLNLYTLFFIVKLGDKERFGKEQIGVKEPFPVTNCQFTS